MHADQAAGHASLVEVHGEAGTRVRARLPDALASRVGDYVVA